MSFSTETQGLIDQSFSDRDAARAALAAHQEAVAKAKDANNGEQNAASEARTAREQAAASAKAALDAAAKELAVDQS